MYRNSSYIQVLTFESVHTISPIYGECEQRMEKRSGALQNKLPPMASLSWNAYVGDPISILVSSSKVKDRTLDRHDEARSIYSGLDFKRIDWPEAIIDSWLSFEQLHGDLEQTYECIDKVERVQAQINAKRYKEAANAAYATSQAATQAVVDTSSEQNPSDSTELQMNDAMEIDIADPRKRKHEEAEREATGSKKAKTGNNHNVSNIFNGLSHVFKLWP